MSQLFFTSTYIPSKRFTSLEEVFKEIPSINILLYFDTNIVIYCRDFYLDPKGFSQDPNKNELFSIVKYLVDTIDKYNLMASASIGMEEACRSRVDFSWSTEKEVQTRLSLSKIFQMSLVMLEKHIRNGKKLNPVKIKGELPKSKIACLSQGSRFDGLLTASYACALKIFILNEEIEKKSLSPYDAFFRFMDFCLDEVNISSGVILSYAMHFFGGVDFFRSLLFTKKKVTPEEKLHQLFNGAIDLTYPNVINYEQKRFPIPSEHKLIPVFVTSDKRLSILHSICNSIPLPNGVGSLDDNLQLVELDFYGEQKPKWTNDQLTKFKDRMLKDLPKRSADKSVKKSTDHILPVIQEHEKTVWKILNNTNF